MDENPWQHWSLALEKQPGRNLLCIHGWKSMATLKHVTLAVRAYRSLRRIHGWKSMATLKLTVILPFAFSLFTVSMDENPWQHWSMIDYTNLKTVYEVSMDENPWQHWSCLTEGDKKIYRSGIHGWKSMATLKRRHIKHVWCHCLEYPWMKIHGNIEALMDWLI